jgi:hypothetical protein
MRVPRNTALSRVLGPALLLAVASAAGEDGGGGRLRPDGPAQSWDAGAPGPQAVLPTPSAPYSRPAPWRAPRGTVERGELAPVIEDGSGLPLELWQGLNLTQLEGLLAGLQLPPRSGALRQLWRRMLLAAANPPVGVRDGEHFTALRLEALYRSGLLDDMAELLRAQPAGPIIRVLSARLDIGLGRRDVGCQTVTALASPRSGLPGRLKGETQLLAGYCAAAAGAGAAAGLAVELAREEGFDAELPLAVLAGVAAASTAKPPLPERVLLLDYRFLELLGPVDAQQLLARAEPALLVALAQERGIDARLQVAAMEAALELNALPEEAAREAYRRLAATAAGDPDRQADPRLRRALLFRALELARAPMQRARLLRALIDEAKTSELRAALARLLAPQLGGLVPSPELAGFAATAVEIALAASDYGRARAWASGLPPWQALIDVADAERGAARPPSLAAMTEFARSRLDAQTLDRLATLLDALDVDVPIALWDAAGRTPQPAGGYLPETGVLAELADAAKRGEVGRTILLAMRALGPYAPAGAHVLALGDAVRALNRVHLYGDARRLALEALLPAWPRAE